MPARKATGQARSAITGRFVKSSTARQYPKTTVVERRSSKAKGRR